MKILVKGALVIIAIALLFIIAICVFRALIFNDMSLIGPSFVYVMTLIGKILIVGIPILIGVLLWINFKSITNIKKR